jgi:PAS domain S-box-containing protein
MVLAVDATERIQQQQQLEDSYRKEIELNEALATHIDLIKQSNEEKRRMGEVIEKINNFVIIIETDGKVRWANKAFLQFSQSAIQEVVGQEAATLFFRDDDENKESLSEFLEVLSKQGFYSAEILNHTKTGLNYWAQTDASPIYGEDGSLDCYIVVQTLITERKLREEKIRQQNRTLRQLAWVSSHELRKPVSSIISLVNLLKEMDEGEERQDCLRLLGECSSELDNLVKDIAKKVNIAEGKQPLV